MTTTLRATIIQEAPHFLNLSASMDTAEAAIRRAAEAGAQLIAFAECWLPGYPVWLDFAPNAAVWDHPGAKTLYRLLAENSVVMGDKHLARLQQLADETGAVIVMGSHERAGNTLYNTSFTCVPGLSAPMPHRKLVPTYTERLVWGQGDGSTLGTVDTPFGPLGTLICWEHWMPLTRAAMHARTEAVHVAQWPIVKDMHQVASRHYAFEGRCAVLAAGSIMSRGDILYGYRSLSGGTKEAEALLDSLPGEADTLIHAGGSAIIGADGGYITEPVFGTAGLVSGTIDLGAQREQAMVLDTDGHYSRPDVFTLSVNTTPRQNVRFEDKG